MVYLMAELSGRFEDGNEELLSSVSNVLDKQGGCSEEVKKVKAADGEDSQGSRPGGESLAGVVLGLMKK